MHADAASTSRQAARRRLPREERARQLLEVAAEVFAERGVRGTTMGDIAARAGVTKPIVYDHFRSKDSLIAAVVTGAGATLREALVAAVAAAPTGEQALADALGAYFRFVEERRTGLHSLLSEGLGSGTEAAQALEQVRDELAGLIATLLARHLSGVAPAQARPYSEIVVGAAERLATRPAAAQPEDPERLVRHVMDVLWTGFAALSVARRWSQHEPDSD
jgi:AcrR family transcriptional regulator